MGKYESRNRNNFQDELMKVYGHCFANNCYDYKDNNQHDDNDHKCENDRYDKYDDNKYDKCDKHYDNNCDRYDDRDCNNDKYDKHDDRRCNNDKYDKHDNEKCNNDKYDRCNTEKEIKNLFNFIFNQLDDIDCDLEKIEKALKRLFKLLDDDCSCNNKKDDFKCLAEDLKVLNYFINKTKKDLKCLAKKTL